jgi:hypothetical protein
MKIKTNIRAGIAVGGPVKPPVGCTGRHTVLL